MTDETPTPLGPQTDLTVAPLGAADADAPTRAGFVALLREPNAGKSTLLNRMVGAKISIVTHKVQTTRARIRGVALEGQSQIVFVDTPGLFRPRRRLDRAMVAAAWGGAADADVIALLRKLNVDRSLTVVLVTHDQQVARHADRTIVLRDGLIVADTTSFAEAKAALEADQPAAEPRS